LRISTSQQFVCCSPITFRIARGGDGEDERWTENFVKKKERKKGVERWRKEKGGQRGTNAKGMQGSKEEIKGVMWPNADRTRRMREIEDDEESSGEGEQ
jgi:hypothetical protein